MFFRMFANTKSVSEIIKVNIEKKLVTTFPNVNLSIFGTICEGERFFSKQFKNYLRLTMGQERLPSVALLSIENDLMREMSFEDVIYDFAHAKSRKFFIF